MYASDIMTTGVVSIKPTTQVSEIAQILIDHHISAVPVIDSNQKLVGMVSEGDLLRRAELNTDRRRTSWWLSILTDRESLASDYSKSHARKAQDIMSKELFTVGEDASLQEIAEVLEWNRIKRVPVLRGDQMVGIVSRANLIQGLAVQNVSSMPDDSKPDDHTIRESLLSHLHDKMELTPVTMNIIVKDGVVHLWGLVDGPQERKAIRIAAENIPGVISVDNRLVSNKGLLT